MKKDYENCIEEISDKHKQLIEHIDSRKSLQKLHEVAYNFIHLSLLVDSNKDNTFLWEIVSNTIEVLSTYPIISKKNIKNLSRNTIDNFIKIYKDVSEEDSNFSRLRIEDKFKNIKKYKGYDECDVYIKSLDYILNRYKNYCGYIHSTQEEFLSLSISVNNFYKEIPVNSKVIDEYIKFYKKLCIILLFIYKDKLDKVSHEELIKIRSFCIKNDVKEYLEYFYKIKF